VKGSVAKVGSGWRVVPSRLVRKNAVEVVEAQEGIGPPVGCNIPSGGYELLQRHNALGARPSSLTWDEVVGSFGTRQPIPAAGSHGLRADGRLPMETMLRSGLPGWVRPLR
jgi:hypothetical protein